MTSQITPTDNHPHSPATNYRTTALLSLQTGSVRIPLQLPARKVTHAIFRFYIYLLFIPLFPHFQSFYSDLFTKRRNLLSFCATRMASPFHTPRRIYTFINVPFKSTAWNVRVSADMSTLFSLSTLHFFATFKSILFQMTYFVQHTSF